MVSLMTIEKCLNPWSMYGTLDLKPIRLIMSIHGLSTTWNHCRDGCLMEVEELIKGQRGSKTLSPSWRKLAHFYSYMPTYKWWRKLVHIQMVYEWYHKMKRMWVINEQNWPTYEWCNINPRVLQWSFSWVHSKSSLCQPTWWFILADMMESKSTSWVHLKWKWSA